MKPYRTTAAQNKIQQNADTTSREAGQPSDEGLRITYGIITKVNDETSQVQVRRFGEDTEDLGELIGTGFLPVINPLQEIHFMYGALRAGLVVRVFWRGKLDPKNSPLVEIIGDEESTFLNKKPQANELSIGPFKIFSGGMPLGK